MISASDSHHRRRRSRYSPNLVRRSSTCLPLRIFPSASSSALLHSRSVAYGPSQIRGRLPSAVTRRRVTHVPGAVPLAVPVGARVAVFLAGPGVAAPALANGLGRPHRRLRGATNGPAGAIRAGRWPAIAYLMRTGQPPPDEASRVNRWLFVTPCATVTPPMHNVISDSTDKPSGPKSHGRGRRCGHPQDRGQTSRAGVRRARPGPGRRNEDRAASGRLKPATAGPRAFVPAARRRCEP